MSLTGNNILGGASGQTTGYDIDQSLRFNDGDSAYLSRTPGSVGNRKTWTMSFWVKRANIDTSQHCNIISVYASGSDSGYFSVEFLKSGTNEDKFRISGWSNSFLITDRIFRDPSSWYHFVVRVDTTNSTADDRVRVYVNGTQETSFTNRTNPSLNDDLGINQTSAHHIGEEISGSEHLDGYLAEFNFIDGQSLGPASFGETNSDTNQWQAIKYAGSYGSNGFYLKFQDSSALGDDSSGNTNDFTATNLAATDQVLDTPTLNYSTLNPLINSSGTPAYSEGNLVITPDGSNYSVYQSTIPVSSGKWYAEYLVGDTNTFAGVSSADQSASAYGSYWDNTSADFIFFNNNNGNKIIDGAATSYVGAGATVGQIVGVAIDLDGNAINFYINNSAQGSISFSGGVASASSFVFSGVGYAADAERWNFGQDSSFSGAKTAQGNGGDGEDFYYTPPTGYKALNTDNLDDPAIALPGENFNTILYTGTGANQSITGAGFQPDMVWIKTRNAVMDCQAADSVRGINRFLYTSSNDAEVDRTSQDDAVRSFDADGFSYGTNSGNFSGELEVSWLWKAGGTASSNGDGSIPSSVSANTTAGFSIVSYTSPGTSADGTIGHGLSQAPELVIVKNRDSAYNWDVWNTSLSSGYDLILNTTAAQTSGRWSTTIPTASLVTLKDTYEVNGTDKYIAYCFHSVDGYSKVGTYTGNGSADGAFVYTGFKPAFLLIKRIAGVQDWMLADNKISPFNQTEYMLRLSQSAVEQSGNTIDILSNGFKPRLTGNAFNASGEPYLVLAIAESPFKYSNAR